MKNRMQTNGGADPNFGGKVSNLAHLLEAWLTFSGMCVTPLTNAYGVLQIRAIGLISVGAWQTQT